MAYAGLGEAYWRKEESTKSTVWVDPARAACEGAVAIDSAIGEARACLGMVLNGTGEYEKAAEQFKLAVERDPTNDFLYVGLATAYEKLKRPDEAEQTYRAAIDLRPHYWATYNAFASYLYRLGRYDEAERMFQQVVTCLRQLPRLPEPRCRSVREGSKPPTCDPFVPEVDFDTTDLCEAASNLGTLYYFDDEYQLAADSLSPSHFLESERRTGLG